MGWFTRPKILKRYSKSGYLKTVRNPRGRKGNARIVQRATGPSGYTALNRKGKKIGFSRSAEGLATRLSKKGYSKVKILD